jgi:hypothetical protein
MRRSKKFTVIMVLAALPIITLMLMGQACTQAGDSDASQTETGTSVNETTDRIQMQMPLDEVAKSLGIDQQELENAFIQAQNELGDGGFVAPPGESAQGSPPDRLPPEGELPQHMEPPETRPPRGEEPPKGKALPEAILAKMAEILSIDQQTLEDAFGKAWTNDNIQWEATLERR